MFNALVAMELPGPGSVFLHQEWDYPAPVYVGDTVTAEAEVIEFPADEPITRLRCVARRQTASRSCAASASSTRCCRTARLQPEAEAAGRWRILTVVAVGELLAMAPWFSASAVASPLGAEWGLERLGLPTLTIAVQLGFAIGALVIAATAAADVVSPRVLFATGALVAALANLGFAFVASDVTTAVPFRFVTGLALAGVYPIGLKLLAGWFRRERGLAIGVLVGALTIGSALPTCCAHRREPGRRLARDRRCGQRRRPRRWCWCSRQDPGSLGCAAPRFSLDVARSALREPSVRLANLGYLGHMWELYAMWTWVPLFLAASFAAAGRRILRRPARPHCGRGIGRHRLRPRRALADRLGRTTLTIAAMAVSGTSAVAAGFAFGACRRSPSRSPSCGASRSSPNSAQFSTAVWSCAGRDGRLSPCPPDGTRVPADRRHDPARRWLDRRRIGVAGRVRAARDRTARRHHRDMASPATPRKRSESRIATDEFRKGTRSTALRPSYGRHRHVHGIHRRLR